MSFAMFILLLVLIYAACGIAAGILQRSLGLISIAHAVVLGNGAYAYETGKECTRSHALRGNAYSSNTPVFPLTKKHPAPKKDLVARSSRKV